MTLFRSLFAALTLSTLVAGLGAAAVRQQVGRHRTARVELHDGTEFSTEGLARQLNAALGRVEARRLTLTVDGQAVHETTLGDLGVRLRIDALERVARAQLAERTWPDAALAYWDGDVGARVLDCAADIDASRVAAWLVARKPDLDRAPVAARYDVAGHRVIPHTPGAVFDVDALAARVLRAACQETSVIEIPRIPLDPELTTERLEVFDPTHEIARYETHFSRQGDDAERARNIEVAASRFNHLVLLPKSVTSFNAVVGPRTTGNGFEKGWQIYKGAMVRGVGGGTCQVSSTLHAAALHAGLDIVERAPHSRPLGYIPIGLDSTVVFPTVDLKIRNPFDFMVAIEVAVQGDTLLVRLFAEQMPVAVRLAREVLSVTPFGRKVKRDPGLRAGRIVKKQKGIRGFHVRRTRVIESSTGGRRIETDVDRYPATPELFHVAPDVDVEHDLPAPPEGSKLLEGHAS